MDANSKTGSDISTSVGPWAAEVASEKPQPFHDFLLRRSLWLPATFEQTHCGDAGTWQHAGGRWSRIEYVALPTQWALLSCFSYVQHEVDIIFQREDHRLVAVGFSCHLFTRAEAKRYTVDKLYEETIGQFVCPELDIHSHATWLHIAISDTVRLAQHAPGPRGPRKKTISPATWTLVCEKREWRNQLAMAQKHQLSCYKLLVFQVWKLSRHSPSESGFTCELIQRMSLMIDQHDMPIAIALHRFRDCGRQVSVAIRADDINFFASLMQKPAEYLGPTHVRQFWATLRKAFPQFKKRRTGFQPWRRIDLDGALLHYFQELEMGIPITQEDLVSQCHSRQQQVTAKQVNFRLDEIPSILDLEDELRATQPYRATGYDGVPSVTFRQAAVPLADARFGLFVKAWLWQQEAVGHKGGLLTVIPKRAHAVEPCHFRGIMLLGFFAKRFHAAVRKRLIAHLLPNKCPGQLGAALRNIHRS